jgi:two-component system, sensor histidine kinase and response regulator
MSGNTAVMSKATLLVVEDEPNLLLGIRDILELDDYEVILAQNGKQALKALHDSSNRLPDLIVSDIMMPHMDGIDLLREVRKQAEWVAIPFIFLTAKGEKSDVQRGKMLGVDDYIIKPFDADDLLVAVDSRLRRQQALNQVQADVISSIKRNILTILNHEFRTPLTLIIAYADMLKENNIEAMNEEDLLLFLREINTGASRLRHLIESFILLVELETGDAHKAFDVRKQRIIDMDNIIRAACDQALASAEVPRPCHIHIDTALPPVMGDREYLVTILRELLDNAIKFSEPPAPVTVQAYADNNEVIIEVIDSGRGIPESELEFIWNTFYQVNREHFEDQGAGSGLAIVKALTEIHNGRCGVVSQHGKGSCFTLALPLL